jgi:hypothetical protein
MILLLQMLRASLDVGNGLPDPDGILINGLGPKQAIFEFEPGEIQGSNLHNICICESFFF